jgi:hypothetical protein
LTIRSPRDPSLETRVAARGQRVLGRSEEGAVWAGLWARGGEEAANWLVAEGQSEGDLWGFWGGGDFVFGVGVRALDGGRGARGRVWRRRDVGWFGAFGIRLSEQSLMAREGDGTCRV